MAQKPLKLGELLIEAKLIDEFQLQSALSYQRNWGGRLGGSLTKLGYISEDSLLNFLAQQLNLKRIDLSSHSVPKVVADLISADIARKYNTLPLKAEEKRGGRIVFVAMSDPTNFQVIDDLQFIIGSRVVPVLDSETSIRQAIDRTYGRQEVVAEEEGTSFLEEEDIEAVSEGPRSIESSPSKEPLEERFTKLINILRKKGIISLEEFDQLQ